MFGNDRSPSERVYVFLDESGNLDFSPRGTRYFLLTSVSMKRPFQLNDALDGYKYDCIEYGLEHQRFHCAYDNKHVRNNVFDINVFDIIGAHLEGVEVHSLIVEKQGITPELSSVERFYPEMLGYHLRNVLTRPSHATAEEIIVITDTLPVKRKRRAVERAVKVTLERVLPESPRHRIFHHDSRSHYGLQVADYCCWAISRKHEKSENAHYRRIQSAVRSEFVLSQAGTPHPY